MRDTQWREIAERYGTPCYIFDADVLTRRIEKIQQVLGPSVSLCYSIKANPFLVRSVQPLIRYLEEMCIRDSQYAIREVPKRTGGAGRKN